MPIIEKHKCEKKSDSIIFQEALYGKGRRVANETKDGNYRCTACGEVLSFADVRIIERSDLDERSEED